MFSNFHLELESTACPIGCTPDDYLVLKGRDRLHNLPGEFTVVKCRTCGLIRTNPRPTPASIGSFYPINYAPYESTRIAVNDDPKSQITSLKHILLKAFQFNDRRIPPLEAGHLLEIGCASGVFLDHMAKKGWQVAGIEVNEHAAENARAAGYEIHTGSLESAPDPVQLYDLVAGFMVFEHLHDPVLSLQKISRWTNRNGYLVLSVPNAASLEFHIFKHNWYGLQLPTHLYHFTPATLNKLLNKCGWAIDRLFHQRLLSNLIPSIGYVLKDKNYLLGFANRLSGFSKNPGRTNFLLYPIAWVLAFLRQTGRITVWARKKRG